MKKTLREYILENTIRESIFHSNLLSYLLSLENKVIVDCGCGSSLEIPLICGEKNKAYQIDSGSSPSFDDLKPNLQKENIPLNVLKGDLYNLPFKIHFIDTLILLGVKPIYEILVRAPEWINHMKETGEVITMWGKGNRYNCKKDPIIQGIYNFEKNNNSKYHFYLKDHFKVYSKYYGDFHFSIGRVKWWESFEIL
ncbi:MAG: hypothetical protein PVJ67_06545 [Candidatus Pacearchaeota archaeon]|jgi:hypothetical protein